MPAVLYDGNNNFERVDDLHPIYWRHYPGDWLQFHADNPQVYELSLIHI